MIKLTSFPMQLFHYLLLFFSLIFADAPFKKLLAYFYLWPLTAFLLFKVFTHGAVERPTGSIEKPVFRLHYSAFAIHLIVSLALLNIFSLVHLPNSPLTEVSIYHAVIMILLLIGFSFNSMFKLINGVPSPPTSIRGIIATMIILFVALIALSVTLSPPTIKDNSTFIVFFLPPISLLSLILWYIRVIVQKEKL